MITTTKKEISDKSKLFYKKQMNRRRAWDVIDVSPNQRIVTGSERTLSKALAMSQLELPVGDMIKSELEKSVDAMDSNLVNLLKLNQNDEVKHDEALRRLRAVFTVREEDDARVSDMVKHAATLANLYSPITVAGTLEASLFFVILPMYRFLGGSGFRTVANDISNDENIHVAVNVQLAQDLGYRRGNKLNTFRKDVIDWLTEDLDAEADNKYLSADFWKATSNNLYSSGKAPQLRETRRSVMPSFFEKNNMDLPKYG